jgi:hypothetical protein
LILNEKIPTSTYITAPDISLLFAGFPALIGLYFNIVFFLICIKSEVIHKRRKIEERTNYLTVCALHKEKTVGLSVRLCKTV